MTKRGATEDLFFLIFAIPPPTHTHKKKMEKKVAAARLATITASHWTGNRLFFVNSLTIRHILGNLFTFLKMTPLKMFCLASVRNSFCSASLYSGVPRMLRIPTVSTTFSTGRREYTSLYTRTYVIRGVKL